MPVGESESILAGMRIYPQCCLAKKYSDQDVVLNSEVCNGAVTFGVMSVVSVYISLSIVLVSFFIL